MAKLAENPVAVDAELDDAMMCGRAEHGEEGSDVPVGRGRFLSAASESHSLSDQNPIFPAR
jgi:hypothetical protein